MASVFGVCLAHFRSARMYVASVFRVRLSHFRSVRMYVTIVRLGHAIVGPGRGHVIGARSLSSDCWEFAFGETTPSAEATFTCRGSAGRWPLGGVGPYRCESGVWMMLFHGALFQRLFGVGYYLAARRRIRRCKGGPHTGNRPRREGALCNPRRERGQIRF